jgi:hypothetical protein
MVVRQFRWILKQLCDADLKVNVDKFDILRTLPEYMEALSSNRPQSNKALTYSRFNRQKEVITRHFQDMVEHYHDHWARRMIAHHSHLKCGQTKVTNLKEA